MNSFSMPLLREFLRRIGLQHREAHRKTRKHSAILALLFLFLIGSAVHQWYTGRSILNLNSGGVHTQAKLLSMDTGDIDYPGIQIEYSWYAPPPGLLRSPMKKFTGVYRLPTAIANDLREGQSLEVVYPRDHPERGIPVLAVRRAFSGIGWYVFFAMIVFLLLMLSLLTQLAIAIRLRFLP
jgi:hypothetical protein